MNIDAKILNKMLVKLIQEHMKKSLELMVAHRLQPDSKEPAKNQTRLSVHGDCYMTGTDCGATGSETRLCPYCLCWLFGTHSLRRDTLLSIDIVGEGLGPASKQFARLCGHPIGIPTL